jgi:outer membrane protein
MKKLLTAAVIALIMLTSGTAAQAQKIAYIDMDSLISLMPEYKVAKDSAQNFVKMLETELISMQNQLQQEVEKYEKDMSAPGGIPPVMKTSREKRLQQMQQDIQTYQQNAQSEIQKRNDQLSKPIYEKANASIKRVATAKGYKMVIDASTTNILYKDPADDLLTAVKADLKIK